jgi:hypothetical protein
MYYTSLFSRKAAIMSSRSPPSHFMRGGRRFDVMSMLVKGDQEILHLKEHPRG